MGPLKVTQAQQEVEEFYEAIEGNGYTALLRIWEFVPL